MDGVIVIIISSWIASIGANWLTPAIFKGKAGIICNTLLILVCVSTWQHWHWEQWEQSLQCKQQLLWEDFKPEAVSLFDTDALNDNSLVICWAWFINAAFTLLLKKSRVVNKTNTNLCNFKKYIIYHHK